MLKHILRGHWWTILNGLGGILSVSVYTGQIIQVMYPKNAYNPYDIDHKLWFIAFNNFLDPNRAVYRKKSAEFYTDVSRLNCIPGENQDWSQCSSAQAVFQSFAFAICFFTVYLVFWFLRKYFTSLNLWVAFFCVISRYNSLSNGL